MTSSVRGCDFTREALAERLYNAKRASEGNHVPLWPYATLSWLAVADECIRQMEWAAEEQKKVDAGLCRTHAEFPNMHGISGRDKVVGMREAFAAISEHPVLLTLAPEGWTP